MKTTSRLLPKVNADVLCEVLFDVEWGFMKHIQSQLLIWHTSTKLSDVLHKLEWTYFVTWVDEDLDY